jgi:hypothetical protein
MSREDVLEILQRQQKSGRFEMLLVDVRRADHEVCTGSPISARSCLQRQTLSKLKVRLLIDVGWHYPFIIESTSAIHVLFDGYAAPSRAQCGDEAGGVLLW